MRAEEFNTESEKPEFSYKPNPMSERSFQILQYDEGHKGYFPVGTYTVLDLSEKPELTEKRVINLITVMNGRKRTIDLSSLTNTRIYFSMVPTKPDDREQKAVFRTFDRSGISKENAILVMNKGVFDEWN